VTEGIRTRLVHLLGLLLPVAAIVSCSSEGPKWQTQADVADALRSEIRLILPQLGARTTDLEEGLGVCGAVLDGSHLQLLSSIEFTPDQALLARMPSGYLTEKKSQGWVVRDNSRGKSIDWSIAQPGGIGLSYSVEEGSNRGVILAHGPCLPKSAGTPSSQAWAG